MRKIRALKRERYATKEVARLKTTVAKAAERMMEDPEVQQMVTGMFSHELVILNPLPHKKVNNEKSINEAELCDAFLMHSIYWVSMR